MTKTSIKFPPQANSEFTSQLRKKVKDYFLQNNISKFGNHSIVSKSFLMLILYLLPYFLMLTGVVSSLALSTLSWFVMGLGMAGLGMAIMHDSIHGSYSKFSFVNKLMSGSLFLLGGFPPNWKYQHNLLHHGYTNITGIDQDIRPIPLLRFSPHTPLKKIHRFQFIYAWFFYGLMTLNWVTLKDFFQLYDQKKNTASLKGLKEYYRNLSFIIVAKLLYHTVFLLVPLLFFGTPWYWTLIFFVMMHFVGGLILSVIFQSAHVVTTTSFPLPNEKGVMATDRTIHQLLTTSDFAPKNVILTWLIGGLNFQVEHHLFPTICHVHYKNISKIVRQTAKNYDIPYLIQTSFFAALGNHTKMLWAMGR